jgi:hypothetical protein
MIHVWPSFADRLAQSHEAIAIAAQWIASRMDQTA